jgi:hypothetical protein
VLLSTVTLRLFRGEYEGSNISLSPALSKGAGILPGELAGLEGAIGELLSAARSTTNG